MEWVLQESGLNQLVFEGNNVGTSVRELLSFNSEPVLVLASSAWDTSHVYVEVKGEGGIRTVTTGRWKEVLDKIQEQFNGEVVKQVTELGSTVVAKTNCNRLVSVDRQGCVRDISKLQLTEQPAGIDTVFDTVYAGTLEPYVRFDNGHIYRAVLNADSAALELSTPVLPGTSVQHVSCGSDHVLLLSDGRVWSCGLNHRGQLGIGDLQTRREPVIVEALDGIPFEDISCGNWHNLALSRFGDIYSWGWNADKQLGHSADSATVAVPMLVDVDGGERNFMRVRCGARHSAAVSRCGFLFTWGWNGYQQLGHLDCTGPAQVVMAQGAVVLWLDCAPWSTMVITKREGLKFLFKQN